MTAAVELSSLSRSDGELLREFAQTRQEAAFAELVRRHGGMVLGVCRAVLGNTCDAEDATQAVFLTLAQKAGALGSGSLAGWLHRVALYVSTSAVRARQIRLRHEKEAVCMRTEMSEAGTTDLPLAQLHDGLARLPEKYRLALLLHHVEGHTQEETAHLLGCSVSAMSMRLNRGREMLRKRLGQRGVAVTPGTLAATMATQASIQAAPVLAAAISKAAMAVASGTIASISVPTLALVLSRGAINMLFWTKIKLAAVIFLAITLVGGGTGVYVVYAVNATGAAATQAAQTQPDKLPATLADIVTFSLQDNQLIADFHWIPPSRYVELKLQDIPGVTAMSQINRPAGRRVPDIYITQDHGQQEDVYKLFFLPDQSILFHGHGTLITNDSSSNDDVTLTFAQKEFTLDARKNEPGQHTQHYKVTAASWADFCTRHPADFEKYVYPLLESLHLESLAGVHDLWAYQVLADRLMPPPDVEAHVKELLEQFNDESWKKRADALDKLAKLGNQAFPVLVRLDRSKLSPEQAARVGQLANGGFLDDQQVKTCQTDKTFLLHHLSSQDEAVRVAAAAQLAAVLGQPIEYDPAGPAPKRSQQLNKLRQQFLPATQPATP